MATMVDVAKRAHVSVATVSRVLNGQATVAPELAARVGKAVEALRYEPNFTARNLRRTKAARS
jgi:LacI family transcriptional regulator